jgi:hypothetical protein
MTMTMKVIVIIQMRSLSQCTTLLLLSLLQP